MLLLSRPLSPHCPCPLSSGGSVRTPPVQSVPSRSHPPHHPSPPFPPPAGFGTVASPGGEVSGGRRDLLETPFLSAKGSLLSHIELSREVRMSRESKEEAKRGTALKEMANKRVDAELIDLQTTFLQVQAQLDEYFGSRWGPQSGSRLRWTLVSGS